MPTADLASCDKEPIHIPEAVQPHGYLLLADGKSGSIARVSENIPEKFGINLDTILGKNIRDVLEVCEPDNLDEVVSSLNDRPQQFTARAFGTKEKMYLTAHAIAEFHVFELEPIPSVRENESSVLCKKVAFGAKLLREPSSTTEMSVELAKIIREITAYDRVMIYQFDEDWHGSVIAESKSERLKDSFYNQHFPASDIPQQARELYERNLLRIVYEVDYTPAKLIPADKELDMSMSILRSVSPVHREYLRNMGVSATLVVSIIAFGKLWGLISCHHYSPGKTISIDARDACLTLSCIAGSYVESKLSTLQDQRQAEFEVQFAEFMDSLESWNGDMNELREDAGETLSNLIPSDKFFILTKDDKKKASSSAKSAKSIEKRLFEFLESGQDTPFHTKKLASQLDLKDDEAKEYAGVLALHIPEFGWLVWTRREQVGSRTWAGNPHKPAELTDENEMRLTPRKSFEAWEELVRGTAHPFSDVEIRQAKSVKQTIQDQLIRISVNQNKLLVSIVEATDDAVLACSQEGELLSWNPSSEALLGINTVTAGGDERHVTTGSKRTDKELEELVKEICSGEEYSEFFEIDYRRTDKRKLHLAVKAFNITESDSESAFRAAVIRDITERKKAETELLMLSQELAETNDILEEHIWSLAHDLKEPVRVMTTYSMLLDQELADRKNDDTKELVETIKKNGDSAMQRIDAVIKFAQIEKAPIKLTRLEAVEVLEEALNSLETQIHNTGAKVTYDEIPPVKAHRPYLKMAFESLISNSIKFSGDKKPKIVVDSEVQQGKVTISVTDNGIGMKNASEESVFNMFRTTETGGTGVGLSYAKRAIQLSGGKIWFDKKHNDGARFFIQLKKA